MSTVSASTGSYRSGGLDHRSVWRWHFYAGLFCIPFVLWLAITGTIFLFKPQIERYLDKPYDHLFDPPTLGGKRASAGGPRCSSWLHARLLRAPAHFDISCSNPR
jgi:hypothetical protein